MQFFQLFPSLKKNDFYVTGESYAGKYVPAISYKIHSENKMKSNNKKPRDVINLKVCNIGKIHFEGPNFNEVDLEIEPLQYAIVLGISHW